MESSDYYESYADFYRAMNPDADEADVREAVGVVRWQDGGSGRPMPARLCRHLLKTAPERLKA